MAVLGVFSGGHCRALGHGRHGRRCARYVLVGHFTHRDKAGHNSFHFTGRINRHKLSPGRYHMRAVPSAGGRLGGAAERSSRSFPSAPPRRQETVFSVIVMVVVVVVVTVVTVDVCWVVVSVAVLVLPPTVTVPPTSSVKVFPGTV